MKRLLGALGALGALGGLGLLAGCAITVDAFYKIAGPRHRSTTPEAELATGRVDTWREISFDANGLICHDVYSPWTREADVTRSVVNPNGFKAATQVVTALEALVVGAAVIGNEVACSRQPCTGSDRWAIDVAAIPFALDILWGTYRSFTIHNEILKSTRVGWGGERPSDALDGITEVCAVGTEIAFTEGREQLVVRVDEGGHSAALQLPSLAAFINAHASFEIAGEHVNIDRKGVPAILAAASAAAEAAAAPPQPVPPPLPSTISVQLDVILPIPVPVLVGPNARPPR